MGKRERRIGLVIALGGVGGLLAWGCVGDSPVGGADASSDQASGADTPATPDVGAPDAAVDSPAEAASPYNDMTDPQKWTIYNLASIDAGATSLGGFVGGAFDGRYVYFAPYADISSFHGKVTRYDTQGSFTAAASWTFVDLPALGLNAQSAGGFIGAVFDGRWVYLVPGWHGICSSLAVRYDTTAPFDQLSSWEQFDTTAANSKALCFSTATFDGKSIYYAPAQGTTFAKFDTSQVFTTTAGWSVYDPTTTSGIGPQGWGAAFDSKFVYFVPGYLTFSTPKSVFLRYDKSLSFGDPTAWSMFNAATGIDPKAAGFFGSVFDGRYLTAAPLNDTGGNGFDGLAVRYDTTLPFVDQGSWSRFDTTSVDTNARGFAGAQFDGKYVYFVPGFDASGGFSGLVARFDPANWSSTTAWSTFDLTGLNSAAKGYAGAVFDGRYVYLVPRNNGVVARFEARSTPVTVDPTRPASFY